jgi:hypothetical protein
MDAISISITYQNYKGETLGRAEVFMPNCSYYDERFILHMWNVKQEAGTKFVDEEKIMSIGFLIILWRAVYSLCRKTVSR